MFVKKTPTLKMGSSEIHDQGENPTCTSHAMASAIRGVLQWRAGEGFNDTIPNHGDEQKRQHVLLKRCTDNMSNYDRQLEKDFRIVRYTRGVLEMVEEVLEHSEETGAHLTMALNLNAEGWSQFNNLRNTKNVIYYPNDDILFPFFKKGGDDVDPIGHSMFVSGWDKDKNGDVYIELKNSWGKNWGNNGKIKMSIHYFNKPLAPAEQGAHHVYHMNIKEELPMGPHFDFTAYLPKLPGNPDRGDTAFRRIEIERWKRWKRRYQAENSPAEKKKEEDIAKVLEKNPMDIAGGRKNRSAKHDRKIRKKKSIRKRRKKKTIRKRRKRGRKTFKRQTATYK